MATNAGYRKLLNEDDSAKQALKRSGYASGGAIDKGDREAVHKHERALHKGQPETKLARGGHAAPKGGARTKVVVNAEGDPAAKQAAMQQGMQAGRQQGMQMGARLAAQKMAGAGARPPMPPGAGPGGPGGPPPPMAPPAASMGAKRGGKVGKRK
jgi:hypothetical protein